MGKTINKKLLLKLWKKFCRISENEITTTPETKTITLYLNILQNFLIY